ncbi:hypothetical protein OG21DRAFT_1142435 [Imleria badia]|nr:hypothetical protein OG21DRAFT_1142435 [Imleria badia]
MSMIDWDDRIILPLARPANVHFRIGASFEFAPVLGNGTSLRELHVSVGELLDHGEAALLFTFSPEEGELVSSCSSLLVTVECSLVDSDEAAHALRVPDVDSDTRYLRDVTDDGQGSLTCYRKDQNPQDLALSIERFTLAVDLCPPDHACFPVVLYNLAVAQLIHCQARSPDFDVDVDVPITLFRGVLDLRPAGHLDHPATLF